MGMFVKIAVRNILRHKRRTMLTALTIAVGLGMYIGMESLMRGLDRMSIDSMMALSDPSLKIFSAAYAEDRKSFPLRRGVPRLEALESFLKSQPAVQGVARRTQFLAQISNYADSIPVTGVVVDRRSDPNVFRIDRQLHGKWFSDDARREIVLGSKLAGDLGLKPGDAVTLYALTKYEAHNADEFRIVGLLETSNPQMNRGGVFISAEAGDEFLDMEGSATELCVRTERRTNFADMISDMNTLKAAVAAAFDSSLKVETFEELAAGYLIMSQQQRVETAVTTSVFLLIAAVGIANSVLMSVYERIREIGVLRALGLTGRDIFGIFISEGLLMGAVGSLLGVAVGALLDWYLIAVGFDYEAMAGKMDAGFPVWGVIYGEWNFDSMLFAFLFGLSVAFLASLAPTRRATRLQVTDALRFT
jgi:ABC-type lipoprotein release transport system permease subunit